MAQNLTEIPVPPALGPDAIRIHHPEGAFVPTPASRIAVEAIAAHAARFRGRGLDWGSGSGLLAIAAVRLAGVEEVLGLELDPRGVAAARENARRERSGGQGPVYRIGLLRSGLGGRPPGARPVPGLDRFHDREPTVIESGWMTGSDCGGW